jgi:lipopolysaccharide transport system permease protein
MNESSHSEENSLPLTVIEPRPGWQVVNFRELWRFRELLFFLTWRDIKVRYKQTVLGIGWSLLQPLGTMLVFVLFLGRMGGLSQGIDNYSLFVFAGILPWTFFANALTNAGNSVLQNEKLVTKVYFPRLLVPLSAVGATLFDFVIALALLAGMMFFFPVSISWQIVFAPICILMLILGALGIGTLLSALIVAQRDFRYVLTFAVQLWMFATPCIYLNESSLGPTAQTWLPLNPAYGLIFNFRASLLGGDFNWYAFSVSSGVCIFLLLIGTAYFRRVEKSFADII